MIVKKFISFDWSFQRVAWLSFRLRQLKKKEKSKYFFRCFLLLKSHSIIDRSEEEKLKINLRWFFSWDLINFSVFFVDRFVFLSTRFFSFCRFLIFFCQCRRLSWVFAVVCQFDIVLRRVWQCLVYDVDDCFFCCVVVAIDCYRLWSSFSVVRRCQGRQ